MTGLIVEEILSHRIHKDKYEFNVKLKNLTITKWITEIDLNTNHSDLLKSYKEKAGFFNLNDETEYIAGTDSTDVSRLIVFQCNSLMNVKLEIGILGNETPLMESEIDSPNIKNFKQENLEPNFSLISEGYSNEDNVMHTSVVDIGCTKSFVSDEKTEIVMCDYIPKNTEDKNNNMIIIQDSDYNLNHTYSQENLGDDSSSAFNNSDLKKSLKENRKMKKAVYPSVETNKAKDNKYVQSINPVIETSTSKTSTTDDLFFQLPVVNEVIFDKDVSNIELVEITFDLLVSMIKEGDLYSIQAYMLGTQRNKLQLFVQNKPSIFVMAAELNHVNIIASFLALGANINAVDSRGYTALMCACNNENGAIIELLVNNGAAMNVRYNGENDVLLQCVRNNKLLSIKILLNLGADFTRISYNPVHSLESFAKLCRRHEIVEIIENHKLYLASIVKECILSQLGDNVQVLQTPILPIQVLSPFEMSENKFEIYFSSDIPPPLPNQCDLLFLFSGLVMETGLKCLITESNRIVSVRLNDVTQQALNPEKYKIVTSLAPLRNDVNQLVIISENVKCRKTRLIVVAYRVEFQD